MTERAYIGYGPWLKYIWKGYITNWIWLDAKSRRMRLDNSFGEYKLSYLEKYIPFIKKMKAPELPDESDDLASEKLYSLWFQGEENAPHVVKKCIASIRRYYGDRYIVVSDKDLYDYISLPDFIREKWEQKKIVAANFSDIVRIELLYNHGGYWFDATDFMTGPIPEDISATPFFMYISSGKFFPHMFVQTAFMRARKHDPLLAMWRELVHEYWRTEEMAVEYFFVHLLFKLLVTYNEDAKRLFARMPKMVMDPTYLLWNEMGNRPYSKIDSDIITDSAFFQKCSYKKNKHGVNNIIPGSLADYFINEKL